MVTKDFLAVLDVMWEEVINDTQMSPSRTGKAVRVGVLLLTNASALRTHISHRASSGEETCRYRSCSFEVLCFMTLRWACPQPHQIAEYVNPLGIRL